MAGDIMRKIIIAVLLIICLVLLVGCSQTNEENVKTSDEMDAIDDNTTEETTDNETIDEDSDDTTEVDENRTAEDNQALIAQLMEEQGLVDENDSETNETEEDDDGNWTIEIIHMRGEPEKDLDIKVDDSVTFISRQPNYIHRIQLREKLENGAFDSTLLDPAVSLKNNESFTYTFEKAGKFQWYSKTNYPTTSGYITVE